LTCCFSIGAHFDILRETIFEREKKEIVEYHQTIIDLTAKLNELYKPIIFFEFLIFAILLCAIAFQIVMFEDPLIEKLLPMNFFLVIATQLWFYCYSGQHVMDKSIAVCTDLYAMDRDYLLIIRRSQSKVKINAFFFCPSLEVFASVINSTYGYMSLLRSMVK
jgi:hypothetical protein